jgi:hypothetical protein
MYLKHPSLASSSNPLLACLVLAGIGSNDGRSFPVPMSVRGGLNQYRGKPVTGLKASPRRIVGLVEGGGMPFFKLQAAYILQSAA